MKPKTAFLNGDVGLNFGQQIPFADDLIGRAAKAIKRSRARAPNSTGAAPLVRSRSLAAKVKGPNDTTSLFCAAGSAMASSFTADSGTRVFEGSRSLW